MPPMPSWAGLRALNLQVLELSPSLEPKIIDIGMKVRLGDRTLLWRQGCPAACETF